MAEDTKAPDPLGPKKKGGDEVRFEVPHLVGQPNHRGGWAWALYHPGNILDAHARRLKGEGRLKVFKVDPAHIAWSIDDLVRNYAPEFLPTP